ncbi:hypothetical protein [Lacihabitans soyangensis]|uniref:hypothetical protein n=1 Tax=Lacihabitans soyangensis TaxID=869394 RepID=UPI0020CE6DBF|nr:hypothetical protein [Lacihabitans soyangensis]
MIKGPRFFVSILVAMLTFGALSAHFGWRHHNIRHGGPKASHCEKGHEIQKSNNQQNN